MTTPPGSTSTTCALAGADDRKIGSAIPAKAKSKVRLIGSVRLTVLTPPLFGRRAGHKCPLVPDKDSPLCLQLHRQVRAWPRSCTNSTPVPSNRRPAARVHPAKSVSLLLMMFVPVKVQIMAMVMVRVVVKVLVMHDGRLFLAGFRLCGRRQENGGCSRRNG